MWRRGEEVVEEAPEPFLEEALERGEHEAEEAFAGFEHEEEVP